MDLGSGLHLTPSEGKHRGGAKAFMETQRQGDANGLGGLGAKAGAGAGAGGGGALYFCLHSGLGLTSLLYLTASPGISGRFSPHLFLCLCIRLPPDFPCHLDPISPCGDHGSEA